MSEQTKRPTVCVIGLGYIGLPTASLLATKGFQVAGIDIHRGVVESINRGEIHIVEPDLDVLVKSAVQSGRLKAFEQPQKADVFILAVPTPFKDNHEPDVSYVKTATKSIAPVLERGNLVILESTSPVGTTEHIADWLKELRPDLDIPAEIGLAHCPERVLPGQILKELVNNDRIIGGVDRRSAEKARDFYAEFVNGEILLTDARTAELSKLSENAYRDVNIAFANELSLICERLGINVWELIQLANRHPRVNILKPGPGVGGHCIAVDPWFIVASAPEQSRLMRTAREVNDGKPHWVVNKVRQAAEKIHQPKIACLGLSYKADIDDLRESPAMDITFDIAKNAIGNVLVVEPNIQEIPGRLRECGATKTDLVTALKQADVIVLLVDHTEFKSVDPALLHNKQVIDTRGIWLTTP